MMRQRLAAGGAVVAALLLTTTSCVDNNDELTPHDALGMPISQVSSHMQDETSLTVVDLSSEFGEPGTFTDNERTSDRWIVIAACADEETFEDSSSAQLAVIPSVLFDEEGLSADSVDEYEDAVDCSS